MNLDPLFAALADPMRRLLLDELADRDGQTLFELHARMIQRHGSRLTRQGLSRHLAVLEGAGLLRVEWKWRSKHHFLETAPIGAAWDGWLGHLVAGQKAESDQDEDNRDKRDGG